MALKILIRTQNNSLPSLAATGYTKENYGVNTNTTLSVNTPKGVLGGSVAAMAPTAGSYVVEAGTLDNVPVGLFVNDAAGANFENAPAVASGKVAVIKGMASVEVDVYETDGTTFDVGSKLYSSANGLLTDDASNEGTVIGIVTKKPTVASPTLGLDMRI